MVAASTNNISRDPFPANPIVYFLMTDRFHAAGNVGLGSYGRPVDRAGIGTFHGGNFAGVTQKLRDGWFTRLGINAIWISAPYEQVHGWVQGNEGFTHEPYHGYWPLDFTCIDRNFGDASSLRELVDTAHGAGIAIILDVAMSHVGYVTRPDGYPPIGTNLPACWGPDWVRADVPGYLPGGEDDLTRIHFDLPKLRTECDAAVTLPAALRAKPDTRAVDLEATPVRGYLVQWLSRWVRDFGIDGFRCDSARHVDLRCWSELKQASDAALSGWRNEHGDSGTARFWMVAEAYGHGLQRSAYFDGGFDSVLNFDFQHEIETLLADADTVTPFGRGLMWRRLDKLFARYATELANGQHDVLSYLSSHDTGLFCRDRLRLGASALMLLPGGVQVFYGDETARPPLASGDPAQAARSDMNWDSVDEALLAHWQRLGRFRSAHVALARGAHRRLCMEPYVFARVDAASGDSVLVAWGPGQARVCVGSVFADGTRLRDAGSGATWEVMDGHVELAMDELLLLETYED